MIAKNKKRASKKSPEKVKKPWGGRFSATTHQVVEQFTESVSFDKRLYAHDIEASIAHALMLAKTGIISSAEGKKITQGLRAIEKEIEKGTFAWDTKLEDVHMNIESALVVRIGDVGKKLHTARSRNDQVATDIRLYLRDAIDKIQAALHDAADALITLAHTHADTLMPGFTHLQVAQPITFGHHMLAWFEMLHRDQQRLQDCRRRLNVSPLGAAALAGTTHSIDQAYTAKLLGFSGICENSLDAVSDRDFAIEFCSATAILMMHLSRFSEEMVLWMSQPFSLIEISDAFCTGSSIMPQKKNPDVAELLRGKTARVYGDLVALLTLMKGQPLAYNRDNQEDKERLFDAVDTTHQSLLVFSLMLPEITVKPKRMRHLTESGFILATDLADQLVQRGVAFRDAHRIVGEIVRYAIQEQLSLTDIPLAEYQRFSKKISAELLRQLTLEKSLALRGQVGAPNPIKVRRAVRGARRRLRTLQKATLAQ